MTTTGNQAAELDGAGTHDAPAGAEVGDLASVVEPDAATDEAWAPDAGMTTVEYAIGTVVAAAFAAVLYRIVTGDSIVAALTDLIRRALSTSL